MIQSGIYVNGHFNPQRAELNPICHLLALLGAHHILHVSRIRVNVVMLIQDLVWTQAKVISSNHQMSSTNIPLHFLVDIVNIPQFSNDNSTIHIDFPTSHLQILSKQKLDELTNQIPVIFFNAFHTLMFL